MTAAAPVLELLGAKIGALTAALGRPVDMASMGLCDRRDSLPLAAPGRTSPNGACRLMPAKDGWIAVNLARPGDLDLIPAWLGVDAPGWEPIEQAVAARLASEVVSTAALLGLPVAKVGETHRRALEPALMRKGQPERKRGALSVLDLSALWAGPLCGAVLAEMGAQVIRIDSLGRPDPTQHSAPAFFDRLNGAKATLALNLTAAVDLARLGELARGADVLITSARPRAFPGLGLDPDALFAANPGLVWVAITGYGLEAAPMRVAFGDDAAAAGGLVRAAGGALAFLGDALADPITGLAAAVAALQALSEGGGVLVDAALANCAGGAAATLGLADRP